VTVTDTTLPENSQVPAFTASNPNGIELIPGTACNGNAVLGPDTVQTINGTGVAGGADDEHATPNSSTIAVNHHRSFLCDVTPRMR
jgi:hypothetical protein